MEQITSSPSDHEEGILITSTGTPQEDIFAELDLFVRLVRFGEYKQADEFFNDILKVHVQEFPVAAEYASFLLESRQYIPLQEFIESITEPAQGSVDESILFELFQLLAEIHILKHNPVEHGDAVEDKSIRDQTKHDKGWDLRSKVAKALTMSWDIDDTYAIKDVRRQVLLLRLKILQATERPTNHWDWALSWHVVFLRSNPWEEYPIWIEDWLGNDLYWDAYELFQVYFSHHASKSEAAYWHDCIDMYMPEGMSEITDLVRGKFVSDLDRISGYSLSDITSVPTLQVDHEESHSKHQGPVGERHTKSKSPSRGPVYAQTRSTNDRRTKSLRTPNQYRPTDSTELSSPRRSEFEDEEDVSV